jgi:hypothetical protein
VSAGRPFLTRERRTGEWRSHTEFPEARLWTSSGVPTIREVEIGIPSGVAQDPMYLVRRFYLCRPGLRFAHGTGPRASSTTAA